jgi:hypothetical protein
MGASQPQNRDAGSNLPPSGYLHCPLRSANNATPVGSSAGCLISTATEISECVVSASLIGFALTFVRWHSTQAYC